MGKVGWAVGIIIVLMIVGLVMAGEYEDSKLEDSTGCHYEYKYKNNKKVKVLDCD